MCVCVNGTGPVIMVGSQFISQNYSSKTMDLEELVCFFVLPEINTVVIFNTLNPMLSFERPGCCIGP